ncbi:Phospholipase D1 [Recurvomyces mirabilis]|nr:Phospholipase D1 [Recurvomyces mirabilis]
MATAAVAKPSAVTSRHDNGSPPFATTVRDVSPGTKLDVREEEEMLRKTNGYVSSPLRTQQRLASLDPAKELPDLPEHEALGQEAADGSFPFQSQPGASGVAPTNHLIRSNGTPDSPPVARERPNGTGMTTPSHRRSVQFARGTAEDEVAPSPLQKTQTWETEPDADRAPNAKERERQASFFGKLKALASPSGSSFHTRGQSGSTGFATPMGALSPQSERSEPSYPVEPSEAADADIEEEESEHEEVDDLRPKKRRKSKRPHLNGNDSSPATPRQSRFASFIRDPHLHGSSSRPNAVRHNTLSDVSDSGQERATGGGVSEDEGRDRIRNAWRRGIEGARGISYSARKHAEVTAETPGPRPSAMRRITGLDGNGSPFRMRADRQASSSAQKWRQVKAGLKMLGQRKKDERMRVDHQKSAQLMAELLAGAPAALVFASMYQRDEHGHKKVPVLLEQLKIKIPHSEMRKDNKGDRHLIFQVDLEYGNGPARMQWTVRRSLQDFFNLHFKYRSSSKIDQTFKGRGGDSKSKAKIPKFPKSAFPYLRGARGLWDKLQDEEDEEMAPDQLDGGQREVDGSGNETAVPPTPGASQRPTAGMRKHTRRKSSYAPPRRTSTGELVPGGRDDTAQRERYNEYQRRRIETYLQQMIRWLIFRADSTRLCKFLELSALAVRLSAEGGWQGKQGLLTIASRQHRDLKRKGMGIAMAATGGFAERHRPKWFLVRHSYVVCVDGPESLIPYDCFLVDSDFRTEKRAKMIIDQKTASEMAKAAVDNTTSGKHHLLRLYNAERKLKLVARSERQYLQFQESLNTMMANTLWSQKQRFGSYAPVRNNVHARWLVDGRDHMWQVSRAIDNARDFVYIHDWWLSPEIYMRRPAAISQKWRLDRLLKRKAEQGVKIFVIVYRNIESAIPIDSEYTKWALLDLHENIVVQRSPNQFRQNQFFWAHHEKLVVVDNMMAFVGGVDLCFGRWDDPCHSLTDDKLTGFETDLPHDLPRDSEHCQVWPGKDYSNPRVQDFYALDRPYEEMYDRTKVPRMPWHDIAMQIIGQPARDVGRHFVQRWNYILRNRVPSRPTPILLPPPEFEFEELERLGMTGTCQVQILRSCSPWSIGTPNKVEHSIMNAYCHLIRTSEHFVYIENQFYISSCVVEGTPIHNQIGNALVERAIRAHEEGEKWQACLVIPLMPGFQNSVDSQDGTSIRLIMQCQYRSICRGDSSVFGRLRARGIDPEEYIRFYSLRQWGKIGPRKCLTTEQLYIHAKCMVVDDRTVIIGSANINERSMLGSRDSEVAAVVTDTKMLPSFMGGEPYEVGEFAHTLRKRLQREHLGIDVDAIYRREQGQREKEREVQDREMERMYGPAKGKEEEWNDYFADAPISPATTVKTNRVVPEVAPDVTVVPQQRGFEDDSTTLMDHPDRSDTMKGESKKEIQRDMDVDGYGFDNMKALVDAGDEGLTDSFVDAKGREILLKKEAPDSRLVKELEQRGARARKDEEREAISNMPIRPPWPTERLDTVAAGLLPRSQLPDLPALDDTDIGGPPLAQRLSQSSTTTKGVAPFVHSMRRPEVNEDCMTDPIVSGFYHDIWNTVAENNTKLYRQVFRCMPDSEVLDWKAYERFNDYNERFMQSQGLGASKTKTPKEAPDKSGPPGAGQDAVSVGTAASLIEVTSSEARSRSKSLLGAALGKLRPGSKASDASGIEMMEKERDGTMVPGSPGSGASSGPTAVPSPESQPLDEKDGAKHTLSNESNGVADVGGGSFERKRTVQYSENVNSAPETTATQSAPGGGLQHSSSQKRRRRATTKSSRTPAVEEILTKDQAEEILKMIQGTLVSWPYDWLEKEERGGNWLYNIDQLAPLEIYD